MPTGYTAGILDGTITNFKDYATLCARAFGATIHMRDDPMTKPYEPRVPSNYHAEKIADANQLLKDAAELTDEQIVSRKEAELKKDKDYYEKSIAETKANTVKLEKMLADAKKYIPPTDQHEGVAKFMVSQIEETIKFDGGSTYQNQRLSEITLQLSAGLKASSIRSEMKVKAHKELAYHGNEQAEEIKRCNDANKWIEDYYNSL